VSLWFSKNNAGYSHNVTVGDDEKVHAVAEGGGGGGTGGGGEPNKKDQAKRMREIRLEQNRKAARESRRRKKVMIEELQRSVIFFSRANATLKQQNDELGRILLRVQTKIKAVDEGTEVASPVFVPASTAAHTAAVEAKPPPAAAAVAAAGVVGQGGTATTVSAHEIKELDVQSQQEQQARAQAVATQAILESQGFPEAAARMAAQTMNVGAYSNIPPMQPGATMQAMANFQTACAQAMHAAIQGMQSVPGFNLAQMQLLPTHGTNMQQAYTDQMTALAMQQAAAAQMGAHHFMLTAPLLAGNAMWAANSAVAAVAANHSANVATSSQQQQQQQQQGQPGTPSANDGALPNSLNDSSSNA
jgi:bZIP transcription factor